MNTQFLQKPYELSLWKDELTMGQEMNQIPIEAYYQEKMQFVFGGSNLDSPYKAFDVQLIENVNGTKTIKFTLYDLCYDEKVQEKNPYLPFLVNEAKIKLHYNNQWYDFLIKNKVENSEEHSYSFEGTDLFVNELSKNGFNLVFDNELQNNLGTTKELGEKVLAGTDWTVAQDQEVIQQRLEEPLYKIQLKTSTSVMAYNLQDINETLTLKDGTIIYVFYSCLAKKTTDLQFFYRPDEKYITDDRRIILNSKDWFLKNVSYKDQSQGVNLPYQDDVFHTTEAILSDIYRGKRLVKAQKGLYDTKTKKTVHIYQDNTNPSKPRELYGYQKAEYLVDILTNYAVNGKDFVMSDGWSTNEAGKNNSTLGAYLDPPFKPPKNVTTEEYNAYLHNWTTQAHNTLKIIAHNEGSPDENISDVAAAGHLIFNDSLRLNAEILEEGIIKGEKYVYRINHYYKNKTDDGQLTNMNPHLSLGLKAYVSAYIYDEKTGDRIPLMNPKATDDTQPILNFTAKKVLDYRGPGEGPAEGAQISKDQLEQNYQYVVAEASRTVTAKELEEGGTYQDKEVQYGIFLYGNSTNKYHVTAYYLMDFQIFKFLTGSLKEGEPEQMLIPGDRPISKIKTRYCFYDPKGLPKDEIDEENIPLVYSGYVIPQNYSPVYNDRFAKVRSIQGKESNRFNLIQTICENFEVWVAYDIKHELNGAISTKLVPTKNDKDQIISYHYKPEKTIRFREYIGKDNYAGFRYGVNLKSIQRTFNSEEITTKLIVSKYDNDQADDGFCSIGKASENPFKVDFLLNFDYYIQQGLLKFSDVQNDLYFEDPNGNSIGYLTKLSRLGEQKVQAVLEWRKLIIADDKATAEVQSSELALNASSENLSEVGQSLQNITGYSYTELLSGKSGESIIPDRDKILQKDYVNDLFQEATLYTQTHSKANESYQKAKLHQKEVQTNRKTKKALIDKIAEETKELDQRFFNKYSRYIQEGSWNSQDYIDDNLYYFDAESVLYTSKSPEVQYEIQVVDLNQLEEYQNYTFAVGDKTYIEDPEFFGYIYEPVKTPYKEEIIISAIESHLDEPSATTITVQNYKTQFEDLFQRISAQNQKMELREGQYQRAAQAFTPQGTINSDILQNSLLNNSLIISNSKDNSVVFDERGITITNRKKPNEIVRMVSTGILMTDDGGQNWRLGVSAKGINANYITTGQLDASRINILAGDYPTFRWDREGLSSYSYHPYYETDTKQYRFTVDYGKFIRFDQFGLYGINGNAEFNAMGREVEGQWVPYEITESLQRIRDTAEFGLMWDGFFLKTQGSILQLSSQKDLTVSDSTGKELIHLGRLSNLSSQENLYGIEFFNTKGQSVLKSTNEGNLLLSGILNVGSLPQSDTTEPTYSIQMGGLGPIPNSQNENYVFKVERNSPIEAPRLDTILSISDNGTLRGKRIEMLGGSIGGLSVNTVEDITSSIQASVENNKLLFDSTGLHLYNGGFDINKTNNTEVSFKIPLYTKSYAQFDLVEKDLDKRLKYLTELENMDDVEIVFANGIKKISNILMVLNATKTAVIIQDTYDNIPNVACKIILTSGTVCDIVFLNEEDCCKGGFIENSGPFNGMLGDIINIKIPLTAESSVEDDQLDITTKITGIYTNSSQQKIDNINDSEQKENNNRTFVVIDDFPASVLTKDGTLETTFGKTYPKVSIIHLEPVFYADDNGDLTFKGNLSGATGSFSGIVEATGGSFNGTITAQSLEAISGRLHNLSIAGILTIDKYSDEKQSQIKSYDYIENGNSGFQITSEHIITHNLQIGQNAKITGSLQVGNLYLKNSSVPTAPVLYNLVNGNTTFSICNNGAAQFGSIYLDPENSTLGVQGVSAPWQLNDKGGYFTNVDISGTLSATVFDVKKIHTSGGITLFRDTWQIEKHSIDKQNKKLSHLMMKENLINSLEIGDKVLILSDNVFNKITEEATITKINNKEIDVIFEHEVIIDSTSSFVLTKLPKQDWWVGINSTDSFAIGLPQKALSFSKYDSKLKKLTPEVIIGSLSGINEVPFLRGSSGLYAENAYLKGALVTHITDNESLKSSFAGVNTLSTVSFNKDTQSGADFGNIIFWAGAQSMNPSDIQNSPFQVSSSGDLYARGALFDGSVFANAKISASTLEATTIIGREDNAALTIKDAEKGMIFKTGKGLNEKTCVEMTSEALKVNTFMSLNNSLEVNDISIITKENNNRSLLIESGLISFKDQSNMNTKSYLNFDTQSFTIVAAEQNDLITMSKSQIEMNAVAKIKQELFLDTTALINYGDIQEYKPVIEDEIVVGYDLYIYE